MRIITTTALASALLFTASLAAQAVPVTLKGGTPGTDGMVQLVRKGGGGGGGPKGPGGRGVNAGAFKQSYKGGGGNRGGSKNFSRSQAGKNYRGGDGRGNWNNGRNRGYAGKNYNRGKYSNYHNRGGYYRYRRGYPYVWGGLAVTGAYGAYAYGNCGWLYRQAEATGSAYWWQRYEDCAYGY